MKKTWKRLCTGFLALATVVNGQFSTSADWASHKHNTNAGKTSEDGVWFGTSEPDDSKGALPYDLINECAELGEVSPQLYPYINYKGYADTLETLGTFLCVNGSV